MRIFKSLKAQTIMVVVFLLLGLICNPFFTKLTLDTTEDSSIHYSAPLGLTAQLLYPNIGHAAIVLNGSQVEVQVRGPNNLSIWDFTIYREYQSYSLTHDTPSYNATTNIWSINVTIPVDAGWDLYDFQITVSDGLSQLNLEEWNAIQVRHSFSENFTIFHVTDTHFFTQNGPYVNKLRAAQYQAALANADLIINTGDLTDDAALGSFQNLRNTMRESRVPYLILPGNHDRDSTGPTFHLYKSFFGPDYYTATIGPDILIVMTNTYQQSGERYRFNFTQLGWIERDLTASNAKTKIVCGHAAMFHPGTDDFFMQYDEAMELQRIARENNMTAYLAGHLHNDQVDLINGTYFILTTSNGGSVWTSPTDPGHHQNGLRKLVFANNNLSSWSWTNWNWSQPWNEVKVSRQPIDFHIQEMGGYISIINNLTTPLNDQVVDFLVEPLSAPLVYRVEGGSALQSINDSSSWFIRVTTDVAVNGVAIVRIYPSNAQAPNIDDLTYPNPGLVGNIAQIIAEVTNPISGVQKVEANISINSAPFVCYRMGGITANRYRYFNLFAVRTILEFSITAYDYSGLSTRSSMYTSVITNQPGAPVLTNPGDVSETGNVTLGWTTSTDDDGTIEYYALQVSTSSDFANIFYEENVTGTTTTIYGLTNNTYNFRVQSIDNDNAASAWSNIENITVAIPPPITPPPPPLPVNWSLLGLIAGGVIITVIVIGLVVYLIRIRKPKGE